ncbi:hypothetical protein ACK83U_22910 (plasmid) [Rhizobium sp. WW22]|uniref:hypothetical protein n=1 Tax=Rhizobium sp. WW22 TaxID=3389070 RepID=UPI003999EDC5
MDECRSRQVRLHRRQYEHDIKGAGDMDLASVLVRTGILAAASQHEPAELTRRHNAVPSYLMPCFSVDAA